MIRYGFPFTVTTTGELRGEGEVWGRYGGGFLNMSKGMGVQLDAVPIIIPEPSTSTLLSRRSLERVCGSGVSD